MGNLRNHMDALTRDVLASTRERKAAVGEIMAQTGRLLTAFSGERTRSAEAVMANLANDCRARVAEGQARSRDVKRLLQGFCRDRHRMGSTLHAHLSRTTTGIASHVAARMREFGRERSRLAMEQHRTAEGQRDALAEDLSRRSKVVAGLIEDFCLSRGEMAQELADRLEAFVQGVQLYVSGLLADARVFRVEGGRETAQELARTLTEIRNRTEEIAAETRHLIVRFRHDREDMAEEVRNRLADRALARHHQVCRLMDDVRSWQQDLQADLQAAHRMWHGSPEVQTDMAPGPRHDEAGAKRQAEEARKAKERTEAEVARKRKAEEEKRAKEAWAKMSDEKKVLHVIRNHPDGLTASQIGEIVDLHPSMAGRLATELVEQGEVGKNESARLYFPLASK